MKRAATVVVGLLAVGIGAGRSTASPGASPPPARSPAAGDEPRLPTSPGRFAPSQVRLVEGDGAHAGRLADVQTCAGCHPDAAKQWRSSAHANASFGNPWYRAVVEVFRRERGREASRFCAGCHEPALLLSGAMTGEVQPDDPRAHAGVTCRVCHGIRSVRPDGNGSYTLTTAPVPMPDPADPAEIAAHRRRVAPPVLRTGALCGSCHRSYLGTEMGNPHHLPGIDDLGAWRGSAFAGQHAKRVDVPLPRKDCRGCHMPPEAAREGDMAAAEGRIRSHRFAGAHTSMAAALGDPAQRRAVERVLAKAATIDVAAVRSEDGRWWLPAESAEPQPGEAIELFVVVRNTGTGHRLPGGTRDLQDTWVELVVRDGRGRRVAGAGTAHREAPAGDPSAFRFRALALDSTGEPVPNHFVHRFAAVAFDNTLDARDARAVRYRLRVPDAARPPLEVRARLLHRRHDRTMHRLACEASRSTRGRRFARAARAFGRRPIGACAEPPVTGLASATVPLAGDAAEAADADRAPGRRMYDLALALANGRQEHLDDARPVLRRAMDAFRRAGRGRELGMARALAAEVAARQNRLEEALDHLDRAEARLGAHPALDRIRAQAHGRRWEWEQAVPAARRAARKAPGDVRTWIALARAEGSAGANRAALRAAQQGLARAPRAEALLRSQALSLKARSAGAASAAWDAFATHHRPEVQPQLRQRCERRHAGCRRDRQPVPALPCTPGGW